MSESSVRCDHTELLPQAEDHQDKVSCCIRCTVINVGEIDTVKQQFEADIFISLKHYAGERNEIVRNDSEHDGPFDPRLNFLNAVQIEERTNIRDAYGEVSRNFRLRVNGTFKSPMKLQHFPFDYQKMTIMISSGWPEKFLELLPGRIPGEKMIHDKIDISTFTGAHEWKLQKHVLTEAKRPGANKDQEIVYPTFLIKLHAQRRPLFYVWNVILPVFCILAMSFTSFAIDADHLSERLGVTVVMLLTAVTFKSAVSSMLPKIPYLTLLDIYVVCNFILQCLMVAQNAVAALCARGNKCPHFDFWSLIVLAFIAVVVNVGFIITGIALFIHAKRMLEKKTKWFKENQAYLGPGLLPRRRHIQDE